MWFSDGIQPKQLWFESKTSIVEVRAYSNGSQSGKCDNSAVLSHMLTQHVQ